MSAMQSVTASISAVVSAMFARGTTIILLSPSGSTTIVAIQVSMSLRLVMNLLLICSFEINVQAADDGNFRCYTVHHNLLLPFCGVNAQMRPALSTFGHYRIKKLIFIKP